MSFFVVLTMDKAVFKGRLNTSFERAYRLKGDWEMALTHLNIGPNQGCLFVMCDLIDYSCINDEKHQFLDYYDINFIRNPRPNYVKVTHKRFNCINISIKRTVNDDSLTSELDIVCVLHFRKA